jgi:SAM-dependent methyltransferase
VGELAELYGPEFFAGRSPLVRRSAEATVPVIMDLLDPVSVFDVGCGQGEWMEAFAEHISGDVLGVDIAANESQLQHDLTEPVELGRFFDLVFCVEVGEHLPESAADTLVDSLVRHCDPERGDIVFGAAVPAQLGTGHINCQQHEYWHGKFAARGYGAFDIIRPRIQHDERISPWYRNNMFVYTAVEE